MSESTVSWFSGLNNLATVLGILGLSLFGLLTVLWRWLFQRKPVELSWAVKTTKLLSPEHSVFPGEVKVFFGEVRIQKLIKFSYIFWNSGDRVIRRGDISPRSPLRITFQPEHGILKGSISRSSSQDCGVMIQSPTEAPQAVECAFDYLESDQGFTVEMLCTNVEEPVQPSGKIIEAGSELHQGLYDETHFFRKRDKTISWLYAGFVFFGMIVVSVNFTMHGIIPSSRLVDAFVLIVMAFAIFNFVWRMIPRFVRVKSAFAPRHLRD